jgi:hypothetical protein
MTVELIWKGFGNYEYLGDKNNEKKRDLLLLLVLLLMQLED